MPLDQPALLEEVRKLNDETHPQHAFPPSAADAATRWALGAQTYAKAVVPASTTVAAAVTAFEQAFLPAAQAGSDPLSPAFLAFATTLGGGMSAAGFTGTVNPAPLATLLAPVFAAGFAGATGAVIAPQLAAAIHGWFTGCTATNTATGAVINWS
jgi:hypothetical protein